MVARRSLATEPVDTELKMGIRGNLDPETTKA
jgi:hypothetical protein